MTTYKDIRGTHIVTVASDPPAPANGQVWYNSTDRVMKGFTENPVGSWATGGAMNTARFGNQAAFGIQTAALMAGGQHPPGIVGLVESYNGSAYSEVADITARRLAAGAGTSTAGLVFGGANPSTTGKTETESWNGSGWTEVADLNNGRSALGGDGTQTSAIGAGGRPGNVAHSETWNGSAWTETNNLNQARHALALVGADSTAAIAFGGFEGPSDYTNDTGKTESWNGSSWTEVNDLNTSRGFLSGAGVSYTDSIAFTGRTDGPTYLSVTELWNGTSWTETTDPPAVKANMGGTGTAAAGLVSGGNPGPSNTTEEWSGTSNTDKTISTD